MNDYVLVKVEGKNVLNYIKWLLSIKITILKMTIQSHKELYLTIHYKDYPQLNKYSKT